MNTSHLTDEELRAEVAKYPWFHTIELRPGVITPGKKSASLLEIEERHTLGNLNLKGKSVLDIGAWNGFWTLAAHKKGAIVSSMDYPTWTHPVFKGKETFDIVCREKGISPTTYLHDAQLPFPDAYFDIVLFMGVLYHMKNPLSVFDELKKVTKHALVLETVQDAMQAERPMMVFYPGKELSNDASNWWGPNTQCVYHLLKQAGFKTVMYHNHPVYGPARGIFHAFVNECNPVDTQLIEWTNLNHKFK